MATAIVHTVSEDGLTLVSEGWFGKLDNIITISWKTPELAAANIGKTMLANEESLNKNLVEEPDETSIISKIRFINIFGKKVGVGSVHTDADFDNLQVAFHNRVVSAPINNGRIEWRRSAITKEGKRSKFGFGTKRNAWFFSLDEKKN